MQAAVTIVIKTFERPKSLKNLLQSIDKSGLKYPILIADDSKISKEAEFKAAFPSLSLTWINLPFDSGLSEGRNVLLKNIETPYFVLCDDDFVFDSRTDIEKAVRSLQENKLDILGGDFYNYVTIPTFKRFVKLLITEPVKLKMFAFKGFTTSRYLGKFDLGKEGQCELRISNKKPADTPHFCDLVNNFFVARTESVRKMGGWDPALKLGEHEDFFLRAKYNNLAVAYLADFGTGHFPVIGSNYKKYRQRAEKYKRMFVQKHGFKQYTERQTDTDTLLFKA